MRLDVNPFRMGTDKEAALKPLEEAAEVFGAWQVWDAFCPRLIECDECDFNGTCGVGGNIAYEIADCITACCNLADRYGLDLQAALDVVEKHNRERGRYDE